MKKNWLGLIFLVISIATSLPNINHNGAIIGTNDSYYYGLISIIFLIGGIIILASSLKPNYEYPEHLYAFVPETCLETGVRPGGWLTTPITPGFDPEEIPTEYVKQSFGGPGKVLVEILNPYKEEFKPRATGPDKKYHGIWASTKGLPRESIKKIA